MRVKNRVTATDGGDGRQYGIDAVEGGGGIGKRQVIGKAMDLPAQCGFGGQPFGGAETPKNSLSEKVFPLNVRPITVGSRTLL